MNYRIWFDGNYVRVRFENPWDYQKLLWVADRYFAYEVKRWLEEERKFEYFTVRRYWGNPDKLVFTTYRGLTPRLVRLLKTPYSQVVYRELPYIDLEEVGFLRKYQQEALISLLKQLRLCGGAILQGAPGSGKTEVSVALYKVLKPRKCFFITLSRDLIIQAKQRFEKYGFEAGLVDMDHFQVEKPIVCCTGQTLLKAVKKVERIEEKDIWGTPEEVRLETFEVKDAKKLVNEYRKAELVVVDERGLGAYARPPYRPPSTLHDVKNNNHIASDTAKGWVDRHAVAKGAGLGPGSR